MSQDPACPRRHVHVCCTLDVEEEGLFSGTYDVRAPRVSNPAHLSRLHPMLDMGVQPTLFCARSVLENDAACGHLNALLERVARGPAGAGAIEMGAHLHHWNTPPLEERLGSVARAVPSASVAPELFAAKLENVLALATARFGTRPVSFRMGRWDLHAWHWELLAKAGIRNDASVRPLHRGNAQNRGPDHFCAPKTPYLVRTAAGDVFEVPLTATPLHHALEAALARGLASPGGSASHAVASALASSLHAWGALVLLPVEHPLWAMKAVAALSIARGNPVLVLAWHSSELMPGGNPRLKDDRAVDAFVKRVTDFLAWLETRCEVEYSTLSGLRNRLLDTTPDAREFPQKPGEDWHP